MKKVVLPLLILSSTMMFSQEQVSITSQELRDEIKSEIKEELKNELRAELEAELKEDLIKEAQASVSKEDFMTKAKNLLSSRVKISGKALLRLAELDWDQERMSADGTRYNDGTRYWSRYNFYINLDAKLTEAFSVHGRIRTGHKQYSFVTFGGNADERFNIILDQFWLNWKKGNYQVRIGRQGAGDIWKNQIGSQFDIPTHDGISASATYDLGGITLQPQIAYFDEYYRNNTSLKDHGKIFGGSITASSSNENLSWTLQTGAIAANNLPNRYANDLAQRNTDAGGTRYHDGDLAQDYHIWSNYGAITFKKWKNLSFQANFYQNVATYDQNPQSNLITDVNGNINYTDINNPEAGNSKYDASTAPDFTNERTGFIGTVSIGSDAKPKGFYAGISYLYLEKYAAMDYFAQYDFARWASTNIKGPEFAAAYRLNKFLRVKGRLFLTEEIKGMQGVDPSYTRSANRFRLDVNINF